MLRQRAVAMAAMVKHRGPDGWGCWSDDKALLVHTRLAIIDTSDNAAQPMHDETGTVHLIFNGEIYNFRALRDELIAAGYRFTIAATPRFSSTATGLGDRHIFPARRHVRVAISGSGTAPAGPGARPVRGKATLLHGASRRLLFGSEIKAISTWPTCREAEYAALHDFLSFGYVPGPGTAFVGIKRFSLAHFMVWERGNGAKIRIAIGDCRARRKHGARECRGPAYGADRARSCGR